MSAMQPLTHEQLVDHLVQDCGLGDSRSEIAMRINDAGYYRLKGYAGRPVLLLRRAVAEDSLDVALGRLEPEVAVALGGPGVVLREKRTREPFPQFRPIVMPISGGAVRMQSFKGHNVAIIAKNAL